MGDQENHLISVVVPLFNEESMVVALHAAVCEQLDRLAVRRELILVDDGSQDTSWEKIRALASADPHVRGIRLSRNFGKEAALLAGLRAARGDAAVFLDGDLQHPPEVIPELIRIWKEENVDILEGVKRDRDDEGLLRRVGASAFYSLMSTLSGLPLKNATDFKLIDRRALDALSELREVNLFFRGLAGWVGFSRRKVLFDVRERTQGETRWSVRSLSHLAATGITSFSGKPLYLPGIVGVIFLVFAFLGVVHTMYLWGSGQAVSGFATVIILLLAIGSAILFGLGIIGVYLARIYEEVKDRPQYIVQETAGGATEHE